MNDREVRNLDIHKRKDGAIVVTFEERFNLLNAHHSEIMKRLRDNNLNGCHVFNREIKYKLFIIKMKSIDQLTGILHTLEIPYGCYTVDYTNAEIVIDTPDYEQLINGVNHVNAEEEAADYAV